MMFVFQLFTLENLRGSSLSVVGLCCFAYQIDICILICILISSVWGTGSDCISLLYVKAKWPTCKFCMQILHVGHLAFEIQSLPVPQTELFKINW